MLRSIEASAATVKPQTRLLGENSSFRVGYQAGQLCRSLFCIGLVVLVLAGVAREEGASSAAAGASGSRRLNPCVSGG